MMFYSVKGTLVVCEPSVAVVEACGVGYQLSVSDRCFGRLQNSVGEQVLLFTHLAVREDGVELFGFEEREELELFRLLNTVSGVGPKAALSILSALSPDGVIGAVMAQDAKSLCSAQGIGNKIAQRIILELKDKLSKDKTFAQVAVSAAGASVRPAGTNANVAEAVNALTVLGYPRQQAVDAFAAMDTSGRSVEALIREGLRALSKQ